MKQMARESLKLKLCCCYCLIDFFIPLTAKGTANPMYSGHVSSLVDSAKKLYPSKESHPVICLESDAW